ncbi:hypothetical protein SAMN05216389_105113 [Oceanobacillus limi]|uniref:Uncharacterized protein n=1 Tax=Oceanobacillus limi TaxID=930131 RepID=A0A1I0BNV3_9BACI|nr:hypothetical protein [Oceanobacillus limi]SET08659.1 hypothetical protein SAMN05216389_105113 [Oceanobacillus limi]
MKNKLISYYVAGNTAEGFVNFLPSNVSNFNHVILLNHPSQTLKTHVLKSVISKYEDKSQLEILLSPLGSEFLDGVIIRDKSIAIVVDTLSTNDLAGAIEMDLNLFSAEEIPENEKYVQTKAKFENETEKAYQNFETGLRIHDDLEEIYINEMNVSRANELAEEFIEELLQGIPKIDREAKVYTRLFGTNTKNGVVNVVPDLLKNQSRNVFIKGRAGTGKSTFMKKIKDACAKHGFDVELYHCSFDPNSVDMVLVRDLNFCIFDSTDPHEFFPERDGDETLDLYEELVTPGTDETYASEIDHLNNSYKSYMKKGIVHLKEAGSYLEQLEQHYVFHEQEVERMAGFILDKIVQ